LRTSGHGVAGGARRVRAALVVTEFALALVLLVAASLLGRSFVRLAHVDSGFRREEAFVLSLMYPRHRPESEAAAFAQRAVEAVRALPGVRTVGIAEEVVLGNVNEQTVAAESPTPDLEPVRLPLNVDGVTPDYFRAAGVPLLRGRLFTDADDAPALPVVIVNETLARRLWKDGDAVGRRVRNGGPAAPWLTVVGVVADLRRQGPDRAPIAQMFQPLAQRPSRPMKLVIDSELDATTLIPAVRAAIAGVDRGVPIADVSTVRGLLESMVAAREFNTGLIGFFALTAAGLAGVGIFGLVNNSVAQRTREFGVRLALGATRGDVIGLVLKEGLKLAGSGIALGVVLSAGLMRVLSALLFEVGFADPLSFAGAIGFLTAVALLASYLPARRALAADPIQALRAE
jgi:predicted permease